MLKTNSERTSQTPERSRIRRRRNPSSAQSRSVVPYNHNEYTTEDSRDCLMGETLLVALARVIDCQPVATSMTIIDSLQDQYITRHLPDGRIINTDHRISFIAGYFTEEVMGRSAFGFIHSEDLQYSLLRFKQMSNHPRGEGSTTYRLVSRTGKLIYLRSRGYLEYHQVTKEILGFVCFNTLLTEEEGEQEIRQIRQNLGNDNSPQVSQVSTEPEVEVSPVPSLPSSVDSWRRTDSEMATNQMEVVTLHGNPTGTSLAAESSSTLTNLVTIGGINEVFSRSLNLASQVLPEAEVENSLQISSPASCPEGVQQTISVNRLHFSGFRTLATQENVEPARCRKRRRTAPAGS